MWLRLNIMIGLVVALVIYVWAHPRPLPELPESRFIKLDIDGHPLSPWAGPWSCVLDKTTRLVWETKTDTESIHDGSWTYSWYNDPAGQVSGIEKIGVENNGDCYFESTRCDTSDLIRRVNQEKTCGITTWRLPTASELSALVFPAARPGEPWIDQDFFPYMQRGDYWTSEAKVSLTHQYTPYSPGARAINFIRGDRVALPYRNAAFVILVNGAGLDTNFAQSVIK